MAPLLLCDSGVYTEVSLTTIYLILYKQREFFRKYEDRKLYWLAGYLHLITVSPDKAEDLQNCDCSSNMTLRQIGSQSFPAIQIILFWLTQSDFNAKINTFLT